MSRTRLKDVVRQQKSSLKLSDLKKHGAFPVFGASGLVGYRDCFQSEKEAVAIIKDGAGIGRVSMLPKHSSVLGTMQMLEPKEGISNSYLFYFLSHLKLGKSFTGSTIPHIYFKNYSDFSFPDVSYNQQCQVAEKLDAIRKSIEQKNNQLSDLDSLVKSRFMEMFGEKYETKPLNEVCEELFAGGDVKKDKSSNVKSDKYPYPIYTNGEKDDGLYGYTSLMRVAKEAVTISGRGTIGFTCLRKEPFYPAVRLIVAVPNQELINGCYLQHFIESKNYGGQGASIPQLTVPMIKNELIPIPPISVQNEFKQFVKLIDKSRFVVQKEIKDLQELLDSKMDEYFGGEE